MYYLEYEVYQELLSALSDAFPENPNLINQFIGFFDEQDNKYVCQDYSAYCDWLVRVLGEDDLENSIFTQWGEGSGMISGQYGGGV